MRHFDVNIDIIEFLQRWDENTWLIIIIIITTLSQYWTLCVVDRPTAMRKCMFHLYLILGQTT